MSFDPRRWTPIAILFLSLLVLVSASLSSFATHNEDALAPTGGHPTLDRPRSTEATPVFRSAPQKAYDLLQRLEERDGSPLPGYVGGREFQNRERRLPRGRYREYDVNPRIRGRGRDAERIVIEQRTGKAYYTGDHYRTFVPLN